VKSRNETKETTTMTIHLIHHADVIRPIKTTLRSFGVPRQDLEDGVAEVQTRTLEYLEGKPLPEGIEQWVALCTTIARHWRLDEKEKEETAQKYCTGLCEEPDEYVGIEPPVDRPDAVDARRMVGVLQHMFDAGKMPEKGDEILDCVQAGMTSEETGVELDLSPQTVRTRLMKMRRLFARRLARLGMAVTMVVLLVLGTGCGVQARLEAPVAPPAEVRELPPRQSAEASAGIARGLARRGATAA